MEYTEHTVESILGTLNDVEKKNAPARLWACGDISIATAEQLVSIVGTRKPSPEGIKRVNLLVKMLVERGAVVVSGLAAGIDAAAHRAAMQLRGRTMAVLGTGLDRAYPPENDGLQQQMMREQLVVSQFPSGSPLAKKNFPIRNRVMALLSEATIIVEAGETSGTIHQGWEALRLGRQLLIPESLCVRTELTWPQEMLRYGAEMLSRENLTLILDDLPVRTRGNLAF